MFNIDLSSLTPNSSSPKYDGAFIAGNRPANSNVIITGTGFGSKPNQAPQSFRDFESAAVDTPAESLGYVVANTGFVKVANDRSHSGTKSLKCIYPPVAPGSGSFPELATTFDNPTRKMYYGCWFYWDKITTNSATGVFKMLRGGAGDPYSGTPKFYSSSQADANGVWAATDSGIRTAGGYTSLAEYNNTGALPNPLPPQKGGWHFYQFFWRQSSAQGAADAFYESWVDGVRYVNLRNRVGQENGDASGLFTSFINMFCGMDGNQDTFHAWIDEEYSDNTGCRVVMTNNATYASSTNWAIQPVVSWTNTQVEVTPFKGNFSNGSTAYYHVFNDVGDLVHSSAGFTVS